MEVIAYKSTFNQFIFILFTVLSIILGISFFVFKEYLYMIGMIFVFAVSLIMSILTSRQSKELITLNENKILDIYYGKETKHILLTDVLHVDFYTYKSSRSLFSHRGRLKILTKHENILVYNVADIQHAVTRLTELITIANHVNADKNDNENEEENKIDAEHE